ncbi:hypothetical protein C5167_024122 [Papaver somniferum]|uniref:Glutamine amidotransferase type-2 domain-containing protein n=1 Tax=Papaver somniferum TaxID=3469 RepID=A0A4Y7JRC5_PAPSO|nr:hypothetical protein C5167_024122 [Papaver somniferum]
MFPHDDCKYLNLIEATYEREVYPGEVIVVDKDGCQSLYLAPQFERRACIIEHIYFSQPNSILFGRSVYQSRREFGEILATEAHVDCDVVIAVPDSGVVAALGYAAKAGVPFKQGLIRSHYVGRTFIEPTQKIRDFGVKLKLAPVRGVIEGKTVVVVDDSIVRGTTSSKIVRLLKQAGATEVHMSITSPPMVASCYYGVDKPNAEELISKRLSIKETRKYIGCDSLAFLPFDSFKKLLKEDSPVFCYVCCTWNYFVLPKMKEVVIHKGRFVDGLLQLVPEGLEVLGRMVEDLGAAYHKSVEEVIESHKKECGVTGIYGDLEASRFCYLALHALQHRVQEGAGIVTVDKGEFMLKPGVGLVSEVFNESELNKFPCDLAIGYVRYSTVGASMLNNVQPFIADCKFGEVGVAHNGNFVNYSSLMSKLEKTGVTFNSSSYTAVIIDACEQGKGGYSLVFVTKEKLVVVRDPHGFRPLVMGRRSNGSYVFGSETCALDFIEATYEREVYPGEVIVVDKDGCQKLYLAPQFERRACIFEHIHFSQPNSIIFGQSVYQPRIEFGEILATEAPVDCDVVIAVPDSGVVMLNLGLSIDEDCADTEADLEMHELVEDDAKGSKMKKVD